MTARLRVDDLWISLTGRSQTHLVRGVSFELGAGETLGLVGESGSGKTLTALATLDLLPPGLAVTSGSIELEGHSLRGLDERAWRQIRGRRIGFVFQEPGAALNPVLTLGSQIVEAIRAHERVSKKEARRRALELLERVAMPDARTRLGAYPHELSGGQQQRAMIAIALAAGPDILVADEPTTALDVTVQAQILDLIRSLRDELSLSVLLISHDLAVVAEECDRVVVMYAGDVIEASPTGPLFERPDHPYTRALLGAVPRLGQRRTEGLVAISGRPPEPFDRPAGCAFQPRCPDALDRCAANAPPLVVPQDDRVVRCWLHELEGQEP